MRIHTFIGYSPLEGAWWCAWNGWSINSVDSLVDGSTTEPYTTLNVTSDFQFVMGKDAGVGSGQLIELFAMHYGMLGALNRVQQPSLELSPKNSWLYESTKHSSSHYYLKK